jgi:hypothetical protein
MAVRTVRVRVHAGHLERLLLPEGAELAVHFEELHRRGSPLAIVDSMGRWPNLDRSLLEDLDRTIEEGKVPVPYAGPFDCDQA